uniref:Mammalian defensins domain-containing protein n=1 Tax=Castor canadensis TaxID=51338 RepID=A0A8C0WGR0_CASCN
MKTFALLAAMLLMALQAQSDPLPATVEEASAQEQMEEEDPGVESSDFQDMLNASSVSPGLRAGVDCYCRRGGCNFLESRIGTCLYRGIYYNLCCC